MNALHRITSLSAAARANMLRLTGEPFFLADWRDAVFLHFAVPPQVLQPFVPFTLDVFRDGMAYVSCVAFTMRRLRPRIAGEWLFKPIATHEFLNVRTYVRDGNATGIYFLAEWLPNALSVWLGPGVFGLPYRLGINCYSHDPNERIRGCVVDSASKAMLRYEAEPIVPGNEHSCITGSFEEFLLERYTAFTRQLGLRRCFHVWHPPWRFTELNAHVQDTSLLSLTGDWVHEATFVGAHHAQGFDDVWMGRPRLLPFVSNQTRP